MHNTHGFRDNGTRTMGGEMNRYIKMLFVVGSQLCVAAVQASNFSYNYFQVGYLNSDIELEGTNVDGNSVSISGSFAVNQMVNAIALYQTGNFDFDLDTDLFGIGFGFHTPLTQSADAVFNAMFLDAQVNTESLGRSDDTGYSAEAKLRYSSNSNVEINAGVEIINLYDDTEGMLGVGALIKFDDERSFVISYDKGDKNRDIGLAFRMEF